MKRPLLSDFHILDCGDPAGLRYQVEAIETDANNSARVAFVHVASCYSKETAELVLAAMRALYAAAEEIDEKEADRG